VQADAVPLPFADDAFDRVFTAHFYWHLQADERRRFVAEARRVGRELVVVDSALRAGVEAEEWQERVLQDGSHHRVNRRYFITPRGLIAELGGGTVLMAGRWFVAVAA
jgi:demethylmenaquinone methyltransferase/2-methoxy-6-polyprenyl-1,4-benzoquinol methylase